MIQRNFRRLGKLALFGFQSVLSFTKIHLGFRSVFSHFSYKIFSFFVQNFLISRPKISSFFIPKFPRFSSSKIHFKFMRLHSHMFKIIHISHHVILRSMKNKFLLFKEIFSSVNDNILMLMITMQTHNTKCKLTLKSFKAS